MTDAEKDAIWRSLPDGFKKEVSRHYKSWHNSLAFGSECAVLDYLFGKHNLTASEEEPRFKVGDIVKVSQDMDWGNGGSDENKKILHTLPSEITEIQGENALIESVVGGVCGLIPLKYLIPYVEERKLFGGPMHGEINLADKIINEEGKISVPVSIEYDDSIWLAYRMELAKEVATALIAKGHNIAFVPESTSLIVDDIVRRLKGGEK